MIEIGRHLEILLLDNDCVVIPGFGGFVTHKIDARWDERDGVMLPPYRTVGFNSQLKINDSLLAQSYVDARDISFPEALKCIEQEVSALTEQLHSTGCFDLSGIGTLSVNEMGTYDFEPCPAGILTPELYGLGLVDTNGMTLKQDVKNHMPTQVDANHMENVNAQEEKQVRHQAEDAPSVVQDMQDDNHEDAKEVKTITIKLSLLRNVSIAAMALILFFVVAPSLEKSASRYQSSSIINIEQLEKLFDVAAEKVKSQQHTTTSQTAYDKSQTVRNNRQTAVNDVQPAEVAQNIVEETKYTDKPYTIVLASKISKKNADTYLTILQNKGYPEAEIHVRKQLMRVIYGHYKNEEEANMQARKMRENMTFADIWVMKLN